MTDKNFGDQEQTNDLSNSDKELALLKQKAQEYLDGWKRAKADYSNFKKEQDKRIENIVQFANAGLLAELLPIFDHFKLAIKHVPQDQEKQDWVLGFIHIKKQFDEFLGRLGIKEIKTVGQKFDPQFHEAVSHEEHEGFESDIIFEEITPGYTLHDKVVNPAKVKVTK